MTSMKIFFSVTESIVTSQGHVDDGLIGNSVSFCMDMPVQLQQREAVI